MRSPTQPIWANSATKGMTRGDTAASDFWLRPPAPEPAGRPASLLNPQSLHLPASVFPALTRYFAIGAALALASPPALPPVAPPPLGLV
jgi:hypothetical protein